MFQAAAAQTKISVWNAMLLADWLVTASGKTIDTASRSTKTPARVTLAGRTPAGGSSGTADCPAFAALLAVAGLTAPSRARARKSPPDRPAARSPAQPKKPQLTKTAVPYPPRTLTAA